MVELAGTDGAAAPLLEVSGLTKHFPLRDPGLFGKRRGAVQALNSVSFTLRRGETLAIVGESGCGKSTLAKCLTMVEPPTAGWIWFDGTPLVNTGRRALQPVRRRIQMIFQDPFGSLNPRLTAAEVIAEPLVIHRLGDRAARRHRVAEVAREVGLDPAELDRYPHEFSGGQRQRIAIARAIAPEPDLVIADEPLSALDASVQSQVLNLMMELKASRELTYVFISHDLAAVRHVADRIAVMYLGRIVEQADAESLFRDSRHPYTAALIEALPAVGGGKRRRGLASTGDVPSPINPPPGCAFHPRCPKMQGICRSERPTLELGGPTKEAHLTACHFPAMDETRAAIDAR